MNKEIDERFLIESKISLDALYYDGRISDDYYWKTKMKLDNM